MPFSHSQKFPINYISYIAFSNSFLQVALVVKNLPASAGDMRCGIYPWVGKIPWRGAWQPNPVFLLGESHGQKEPGGLWSIGHKESNTTEDTLACMQLLLFFYSLVLELLASKLPILLVSSNSFYDSVVRS